MSRSALIRKMRSCSRKARCWTGQLESCVERRHEQVQPRPLTHAPDEVWQEASREGGDRAPVGDRTTAVPASPDGLERPRDLQRVSITRPRMIGASLLTRRPRSKRLIGPARQRASRDQQFPGATRVDFPEQCATGQRTLTYLAKRPPTRDNPTYRAWCNYLGRLAPRPAAAIP